MWLLWGNYSSNLPWIISYFSAILRDPSGSKKIYCALQSYSNSDQNDPQFASPVPLRTPAPTAPTSWPFPTLEFESNPCSLHKPVHLNIVQTQWAHDLYHNNRGCARLCRVVLSYWFYKAYWRIKLLSRLSNPRNISWHHRAVQGCARLCLPEKVIGYLFLVSL
jgi:hypothetical protein